MNYASPELNRRLAAEYVLGTLRGPARRRYERLMSSSDDARFEVGFWELRLSEFGQIVNPIAPPPQTRLKLHEFVERTAPLRRPAATPARHRFRFKRHGLAGLAAAASLVLAFSFGQQHPLSPVGTTGSMGALAANGSRLPMYVASLRIPASSMQWLLSLAPDRRNLTVEAADDYDQLGRFNVVLWWNSPTRGPIALGILPSVRDGTASIALPAGMDQQTQATFTISLEPQGRTASIPSGAVLDTVPDLLGAI